jgi:hypothetical protein
MLNTLRGRFYGITTRSVLLLLALSLALFAALAWYLRSSADAYPVADGAVLEIYTLHAVKGFWPFGPYSQFHWHHPGPLLFYLLAPLYALGGFRTIALHAGAMAIGFASVLTIAIVLLRSATPAVACTGIVALGLFLFRVDGLVGSYWNPHIVVLPVAALLLLCARLASGRLWTLPVIILVGSFLAQTHVSLVPHVGALVSVALAAAILWGDRRDRRDGRDWRSLGRALAVSAALLLLLWLLPLIEQIRHWPGNLSQLATFFAEPFNGPTWATVLDVWGDTMTALLRPGLKLPVGWAVASPSGYQLPAMSTLQLLLLAAGSLYAARRGKKFDAALCSVGLVASVIAFWSITRIRTLIGDYMVFWMAILGAMNWAVLVGLAIDAALRRLHRERVNAPLRVLAYALTVVLALGVLFAGQQQIAGARQLASRNLPQTARDLRVLCTALDAYLAGEHIQRPLLQVAPATWGDAAGVIVDRYRRGLPFAVSPDLVWMFGAPLAPTGQEDRVIVIADRATHVELSKQPGDYLIAYRGSIYLHTNRPSQP